MIREIETKTINGLFMVAVLIAVFLLLGWMLLGTIGDLSDLGPSTLRIWQLVALIVLMMLDALLSIGLFTVAPNEGRVLQLFGKYVGTVKTPGLQWANPFYTKRRVSLRVRNFETGKLKVNDKRGNPIELAAIVVWKVVDTAEAVFLVDDFTHYVHVQCEAAGRSLATGHPYDVFEEGEISLVSHTEEVSQELEVHIRERLDKAGVEVIEARISHLAYAPEIASAMLQRQQAAAVIAARSMIVEGAVGMVENALELLSRKNVVRLDEERKAAMVSNLLVVLCGDSRPQPILNTGSMYT